jgi:hypothetical protein
MILITTFYESDNIERTKEYIICLENNIKNEFIENIYLLNEKIYDGYEILMNKKIIQINFGRRITYSDAIIFVNENFKGNICIISNSDIYFDNTLRYLINYNMNHKVLALSRNDMMRLDSQDSWIFKAPLRININQCNFHFGILGCDNRFARICRDGNNIIINPSKTIKTYHVHKTQYRTYNNKNRIKGLYYFIEPSYL